MSARTPVYVQVSLFGQLTHHAPRVFSWRVPTAASTNFSSTLISQVAHLGVTIAAVIHQPGAQLFQGLDDLLLLGHGARFDMPFSRRTFVRTSY